MAKNIVTLLLGILAIVLGIVAWSSIFTMHQTRQGIVMQFGEPKRIVTES